MPMLCLILSLLILDQNLPIPLSLDQERALIAVYLVTEIKNQMKEMGAKP